jgi:hypothetical protein
MTVKHKKGAMITLPLLIGSLAPEPYETPDAES